MSGKSYPTAPPMGSYPAQSSYPTSQYPQPQYQTSYPYQQPQQQQQQPYGQTAGMYAGPPPYTSQPQEPPPPYSVYPGQAPPSQPQPPMQMYPQQRPQQPQTIMVPGMFDASARFDGVAQPRIPPPPPGVMPNAAQMAAMQGHTVVGTQQRANWFSGNSGGSDWGL